MLLNAGFILKNITQLRRLGKIQHKHLNMTSLILITIIISIITISCQGLSTNIPKNGNKRHHVIDRQSVLQTSAYSLFGASTVFVGSQPAYAKQAVDPALVGTKSDPKFQACLSTCMYECTKPKGDEQKSRSECLPECKQKCAETKEQLLKGTPKK